MKKPGRQRFSKAEDDMILSLVDTLGEHQWDVIAQQLPNRTTRQCRERWLYHLNPNLNDKPFTKEEDRLLLKLYKEYGSRWTTLSKFFKGRSNCSLKNRFFVLNYQGAKKHHSGKSNSQSGIQRSSSSNGLKRHSSLNSQSSTLDSDSSSTASTTALPPLIAPPPPSQSPIPTITPLPNVPVISNLSSIPPIQLPVAPIPAALAPVIQQPATFSYPTVVPAAIVPAVPEPIQSLYPIVQPPIITPICIGQTPSINPISQINQIAPIDQPIISPTIPPTITPAINATINHAIGPPSVDQPILIPVMKQPVPISSPINPPVQSAPIPPISALPPISILTATSLPNLVSAKQASIRSSEEDSPVSDVNLDRPDSKLITASSFEGRDLFSYEFCKCEVKGQIKVKSGKNLMGKCDVNFAGSLGHFDMEEVRHVNTAEGAKRSEAVVTWQHLFQWPNESKGPAKSHHIYPFLVSKNKTHRKKNPASFEKPTPPTSIYDLLNK
ncbi:hypothetical protein TRFO_32398 [Tritrichomonas foetus]|uniref:Myb-like DNA-binding domain containing protein n=1 Tax=Tritrichomonas foetus TaxID=1144522 RepID=A0A1J4JTJ2_9EUKA|nr:hypothetical protein TRFO_32398 [Tritrichomonas foetus]|eukprot:OHT00838.1 hypothetical protein TRFO_32398 [Tritrichomonas foetus]